MLVLLRFLGFSLSYLSVYISRPVRIYQLIRNLFKKEFLANNLLEQRIYDAFIRIKLNRKSKKLVANN